MLKGKTVVLGITGGIAAYKACELVSRLKKLGANVHVIMTEHARHFVMPLTFATLSKNRVVTEMFDTNFEYEVGHISLAKAADLFVIAPATANTLSKIAAGIADDMLTTTVLATKAKVLVCPAMNTAMYENPIFTEKLNYLKSKGYEILEPTVGLLACNDVGKGKMSEPSDIAAKIVEMLLQKQDYKGKTLLITAGATEEDIDPVRYITNRSSGKMGAALAECALKRGAEVIFIAGKTSVPLPTCEIIKVKTTQEMCDEVEENLTRCDMIIKAAAPADYRVKAVSDQKIKSNTLTLSLEKNPDIAKMCGEKKGQRKLIIFCAETENLIVNAKEKLLSKNADLIVANDVTKEGAGFDTDTNIVTIIDRNDNIFESGKKSKTEIADLILDRAVRL